MRWDSLFGDLEGQLEFELESDARARRVEDERLRVARLTLRDRLQALRAGPGAAIELGTGERLSLRVSALGRDWLAGDHPGGRSVLVPLAAVVAVHVPAGAVAESIAPTGDPDAPPRVADRISLGFVLRDLARRRRGVTVTAGVRRSGTIDRVGADHLDLAVHDREQPRRPSAVSEIAIVPLGAISVVDV